MTQNNKGYFPMFVDLNEKLVIFIGGGKIAERRIKTLIEFGAKIEVYSPQVSEGIKELIEKNLVNYFKQKYEKNIINNAFFVVAATNDKKINQEVYEECKGKNIKINVISDKSLCDFYFPGVIKKKDITIGVCGNGKNHSKLKEFIDDLRNKLKDN